MPVIRLLALLTAAGLVFAIPGCGGGPEMPTTVPVSGKISLNGKPLDKGMVTFSPIDKGSETQGMVRRPATSGINADGTYSLGTFAAGDGAVPGDYLVIVTSYLNDPTDEEYAKGVKQESAIPLKYTNERTSGLKATVPAEGAATLDFDLK